MSLTENSNQVFLPGVQQNLTFGIWPLYHYHATIFVLKMSAFYVCCIYSSALQARFFMKENNMNPDQTAPLGAVCSGSRLFAVYATWDISRWESRRQKSWMAGKWLTDRYLFLPQTSPPQYYPGNITIPVAVYSGTADWLVTPSEMGLLVPQIKNLVKNVVIDGWEHLDFVWAMDAPSQCYNDVIELFERFK